MDHSVIGRPVNLGGVELKNRIIFAPTSFGLPRKRMPEAVRRIADMV